MQFFKFILNFATRFPVEMFCPCLVGCFSCWTIVFIYKCSIIIYKTLWFLAFSSHSAKMTFNNIASKCHPKIYKRLPFHFENCQYSAIHKSSYRYQKTRILAQLFLKDIFTPSHQVFVTTVSVIKEHLPIIYFVWVLNYYSQHSKETKQAESLLIYVRIRYHIYNWIHSVHFLFILFE